MNASYWSRRATASRPSARTCCVDEILKTRDRRRRLPGRRRRLGELARHRARARAASSTRCRRKYCDWAGIVDLDPKPPVLWTHGTADIVVADGSPLEMGTLGAAGRGPGLARARTSFPPQPMVAPDPRRCSSATREAGGAVRDRDVRGLGPLPADRRARALGRTLLRLPGLDRSEPLAGRPAADRARVLGPATTPRPTASGSRSSRARSPTPTGATGRCSSSCRAGPGSEAPRPDAAPELAGVAGPRAAGVPRAHARPARHRALDARSARCRADRAEQAQRLTHFRADAIVRDAEHIRRGAGRRALEPARPELRRAVRHDLPLDRARGRCARRS